MKEAIITYREKPDAEGGCFVDHWQELIRCKDCEYRPELKLYSDRQGNYTAVKFPEGSKCPCQCEDFFYSWYPKDDWFCANGKRKNQ